MKYITYFKETLKVNGIFDKEPIAISDNLGLARCETIPQGDKFTVANLQDKTEKYTIQEPKEIVKTDEYDNEYTETEYIEVEKEKTYQTCDLVGEVDTKRAVLAKIKEFEDKLDKLDYIGTKIATGRGTREEYAEEIALMNVYANTINELREQLKENYYE